MKKLVVAFASLISFAHAGVLYDSISLATPNSLRIESATGAYNGYYGSFTVAAGLDWQFSGVDLFLKPGTGTGRLLDVGLYYDGTLNRPGLEYVSLGSISESQITSSGEYSFSPLVGEVLLDAGTRYWIGIKANTAQGDSPLATTAWWVTAPGLAPGPGDPDSEYRYGSTSTIQSLYAVQMRINGEQVPEPGTILISVAGLAVLALFRCRRSA